MTTEPERIDMDPSEPGFEDAADDFTIVAEALASIATSLASIATSQAVLAADVTQRNEGERLQIRAEYRRLRTENEAAFSASKAAERTFGASNADTSLSNSVDWLRQANARLDSTGQAIDDLLAANPWLKDEVRG
jgi:hypothetical protein